MLDLRSSREESANAILKTTELPIGSIVRALCQAADSGPDLLYEVILKLSLRVEATAPMYGLSLWTLEEGQGTRLGWAEGLLDEELVDGELIVSEMLTGATWRNVRPGDSSVCFVLTSSKPGYAGAALYGKCVRPLTDHQANDLQAIMDLTRLAHSHVSVGRALPKPESPATRIDKATLPGMVFAGRAMADVARVVARVKDSCSTVLITGESGTGKELVARAIHRLS